MAERRTREKGSSRWTYGVLTFGVGKFVQDPRDWAPLPSPHPLSLFRPVFSATTISFVYVLLLHRRLRNLPTSPADVRARRTRACPFLPLNPVGPRVARIKKDCLTIRRGSNIALEDALVLCSTGRPARKPALTFPDTSQRLPISPLLEGPSRRRDFVRETDHVFAQCPRFYTVNKNEHKLMSGGSPY